MLKTPFVSHPFQKFFVLLFSMVVLVTLQKPAKAVAIDRNQSDFVYIPGPEIVIIADDFKGLFHVPPPPNLNVPSGPTVVTINVVYVGLWTPDAQDAFQEAVDIWAGLLTLPSTPPISIDVEANWTPLAANVLGSAGAKGYWFGGSLPPDIAYPDALADAIVGFDLNPTFGDGEIYEIVANFNSDFANWYTGVDGAPGVGEYDLMTVVLHELGHGLGFAGSANVSAGNGSFSTPPFIFDCFTADGSNVNLLTYTNPSAALGAAFTGDDIHFGGPNTVAGSGTGNNGKLYAPAAWNGGSSYSHWDDFTYDGTVNALMTHALGLGEAVHDPGPLTMGVMTDIGWNGGAIPPTAGCPSVPTAISLQTVNASSGFSLLWPLMIGFLTLVSVSFWQFVERRSTSTT